MLFLTTSGEFEIRMSSWCVLCAVLTLGVIRLLDKIAKDIMVCENKTVTRWDGSISAYKKYLRKKMIAAGGV